MENLDLEVEKKEEIDLAKLFEERFSKLEENTNKKLNTLESMLAEKEKEINEYKTLLEKVAEKPDNSESNQLKDIFKAKAAEKASKEEQERLDQLKRIEEENKLLKLEKKVNKFIKDYPYLEDVVNEKIANGKITSAEQLETEFTNAEIKKMKQLEELKATVGKFGADPLNGYNLSGEGREMMQKQGEMKQLRDYWDSIL
jgi:hypothetical protein